MTQPGNKERGLMEARLEGRWDRMEKEERHTQHGKRKWRVHTVPHRDEQRRQGRDNSDSGEVQEPTEEDEASKGWTDNLIRSFTSVWKQDPRIQEFEADGSQPDGERLCKEEEVGHVDLWDSFVGKEKCTREMAYILVERGASVLAEGLSGAVASGLGKVRYLN